MTDKFDRIETRLDSIESKIDRFIERITKIETAQGMITTGFVVVVAPVVVGLVIYLLTK
jgi:hypothetical protein